MHPENNLYINTWLTIKYKTLFDLKLDFLFLHFDGFDGLLDDKAQK